MSATLPADHVDFQQRMQQLDALLEQLNDPALREKTGQIVQGLMEFHAEALTRMLGMLDEHDPAMLDKLAQDEVIGSLLLLYNLHPQDIETRVKAAMDSVRPYMASHGGNVEISAITADGVVHLHMQGSCHGCPSSSATLKNVIERAIVERAPDVAEIVIEDLTPTQADDGAKVEISVKGHSYVLAKESA